MYMRFLIKALSETRWYRLRFQVFIRFLYILPFLLPALSVSQDLFNANDTVIKETNICPGSYV